MDAIDVIIVLVARATVYTMFFSLLTERKKEKGEKKKGWPA